MHDLHHYVTDATKETGGPPHPEIERFVIIDDGFREEFDKLFPEQRVSLPRYSSSGVASA